MEGSQERVLLEAKGKGEGAQEEKGLVEFFFRVDVEPRAMPRPKARRIGNIVQIYYPSSKEVLAFKDSVIQGFEREARRLPELDIFPLEGPISFEVEFYFQRPYADKGLGEDAIWHIKRPDLDNLVKGVMDALKNLAWKDDSQVAELIVRKFYGRTHLEKGATKRMKTVCDESYLTVRISRLKD